MCKEFAPSVPFFRLIGCSGFGDSFGFVKKSASDKIQEIISLGSSFKWNDAVVCGGIICLKILVRDSSEMCKSLESEYAMMSADPLSYWGCRDTLLLMRIQPNHSDTALWISFLPG